MMHARTATVMDRPQVNPYVPAPGEARGLPPPDTAGASPAPAFDGAAAQCELRRLRYFRDLLLQGFESTVWPDRPRPILREERQALGIDLPELDAVPLWSMRCGGGMVTIPFIEYILGRVRQSAARFTAVDDEGEVAGVLDRLEEERAAITPSGDPAPTLPRLGDVYVPEALVARLCGFGGILDQVVDSCRAAALRRGAVAAAR